MPKLLIVCSDGTWNRPDQDHPTNVRKTCEALAPTDAHGRKQLAFYDPGVGVEGGRFRRILDGALGIGLSQNVQDAYRFLVENYEDGDEIFLFGFSRGAYTVRSLAGLIGRVGLLHRDDLRFMPDAYALYRKRRKDEENPRRDERLKADYEVARRAFEARLPKVALPDGSVADRRRYPLIRFIGVWDTVGSLGIPAGDIPLLNRFQPTFHDTELNCFVENAYQALAIDEQRRTFSPAIWKKQTNPAPPAGRAWVPPDQQKVEQRWFAGAHSNVGGGYPDTGLSDIAWAWMIDRARRHGLAFDQASIDRRMGTSGASRLEDSWANLPWRFLGRASRTPLEASPDLERLHHSVERRWHAEATEGREPHAPYPYRSTTVQALLDRPGGRGWDDIVDREP